MEWQLLGSCQIFYGSSSLPCLSGFWRLEFISEAYTGLAHFMVLLAESSHTPQDDAASGLTDTCYVHIDILLCPLCAYVYVPGFTLCMVSICVVVNEKERWAYNVYYSP